MIGHTISDRYEIKEHLGTGGMATVWLAEDKILGREVAIKTFKIDSNDEAAIKRFYREARAVTSLSHPNIVSIYDVENVDDYYYLVLEYVDGETLKSYMNRHKKLPLETLVSMIQQVAEGLEHAHQHGVIHRDIKPQNILIDKNGIAKITDFGIARSYGDTTLTQTHQMMGTVYYLSPEQARGNIATVQSDIYSLGIAMFEMLTGEIPYRGESAIAIALKHLQEPLPDIESLRSNVPQSVKNVILKATMKNPNERYVNAQEMVDDLITCLDVQRLNEVPFVGFSVLANTQVINKIENDRGEVVEDESTVIINKNNQIINEIKKEKIKMKPATTKNKKFKKKNNIIWKLILLVSGFILLFLTISYLFFSSNKIVVPDVVDLTVAQATEKIEQAGLQVGKIDEVANENKEKGLVIDTSPSSEKKVDKGKKIDLSVSSGKATITMPDYTGYTLAQVKKSVANQKFKSVKYKDQESTSIEKGKVLSQNIEAGEEISPADTDLIITVSKGQRATIITPDLRGLSLATAQHNAKDYKIEVDGNYTSDSAIITGQNPLPGDEIAKDSIIYVTISSAKEEITDENKEKTSSSSNVTRTYVETITLDSVKGKLYIEDAKHNYSEVAQSYDITDVQSKTFTLTAKKGGTAKYKLVDDSGNIILTNEYSYEQMTDSH